MAVIVRKKVIINGKEIIMTPFLGKGVITKEGREKAIRLDDYLNKKMKQILEEMRNEGFLNAKALRKWHALGKKLSFIEDKSLVDQEDIETGYIWLAIWQHCPVELFPGRNPRIESVIMREKWRRGRKFDHLYYCYICGRYDWKEIKWVHTWSNWMNLMEIPGLIRDPRIIPIMKSTVSRLNRPIKRKEFRAFLKSLSKFFSTKKGYRDTSNLSDTKLRNIIVASAKEAGIF